MKTSPSLQKQSRFSTGVSFAITAVIYAVGLWIAFASYEKVESLAQSGTKTLTMSLASINTHSNQLQHAQQAPQTPPQEKPKEKPKEEPKTHHNVHHKIQHKPKPEPKPKPKPKPEPKPTPKPEPKPKPEVKPEPKPEPAKPAKEEANKPSEPTPKQQKREESNQKSEGAQASAQAYNPGVSNEFLMKIQMAISSKNRYPRMAMVRGIEGEVLVEFTLNADGSTTDIRVAKSSGSEILNRAAVQAVKEAARLFPTPKQTVHLKIPIAYTIKEE
ncbi:energy transducer TonB [Helicobacter labacensis]|uniref:energy transducer TonB n=1 Tax=Helicobacter labacensis TaxID=2316079 RepID=UPI000EB032A5|nr:energy transducer TonB [Helicobacter labacensis]